MVKLLIDTAAFRETLTMSMLDWFFQLKKKRKAGSSSKRIAYCFRWCWIYDIAASILSFLTLKGVQNDAWQSLYDSFCLLMQSEYERHDYLLKGSLLKPSEQAYYRRILDLTGSEADYQVSLLYLSHYLRRYYVNVNEKVSHVITNF